MIYIVYAMLLGAVCLIKMSNTFCKTTLSKKALKHYTLIRHLFCRSEPTVTSWSITNCARKMYYRTGNSRFCVRSALHGRD